MNNRRIWSNGMLLLLIAFHSSMHAKPLVIFVNNLSFHSPVEGNYTEVHLKIPAATLCFESYQKQGYAAGAEMEIVITGESDTVFHEAFMLTTPVIKDTTKVDFDLVDIRRARINKGHYLVYVSAIDHKSRKKVLITSPLQVQFNDKDVSFSNIMMVDTFYISPAENVFTRSDIDYIPEVNNYYSKDKIRISMYAEMYNLDQTIGAEDARVRIYISDMNGAKVPGFIKSKTLHPQKVNIITEGFDTKNLPDGIYRLNIDAKGNTGNTIAVKSVVFYKNVSPFETKERNIAIHSFGAWNIRQLSDFLEYLAPISTADELTEAVALKKKSDTAAIRNYFINFWKSRDRKDPYDLFLDYFERVTYVQAAFKSGFTQGYKTDRGAAVLRYGKPDYIAPYIDEEGAYPYEVWQYYKLKAQNNVRFIFYNPSGINNEYVLLHSDALGEPKNPNWKQYIYYKVNTDNRSDHNTTPNIYGIHPDDRVKE